MPRAAVRPLQGIIRSYRQAAQLAVDQVKKLAVDIGGKGAAERREMLQKCAQTSLNSKLVSWAARRWRGCPGGAGSKRLYSWSG